VNKRQQKAVQRLTWLPSPEALVYQAAAALAYKKTLEVWAAIDRVCPEAAPEADGKDVAK
jgi:hypothetical protein